MSPPEQQHIVSAFSFELSHVVLAIRQRMVDQLQNVDEDLASRVAQNLGLTLGPQPATPLRPTPLITVSPSLSQANKTGDTVVTRIVAILAADGVDGQAVSR